MCLSTWGPQRVAAKKEYFKKLKNDQDSKVNIKTPLIGVNDFQALF